MWSLLSKSEDVCLIINDSEALHVEPKETLLDTALRHGYHVPHSCRVGGCGTCKCKLLEGKVREFTDTSYLLSKPELQENYILACQTRAKSNVAVEFAGWSKHAKPIDGKIESIRELTHDIFEVNIRLEESISYLAGQYMKLSPAAGSIPARCYSFSRAMGEPECTISFFVRRVENGNLSHWLTDDANIGASIIAEGPYGDFYLRDIDKPTVFIAGGSGLAPVLATMEGAIEKNHKVIMHDCLFLFGAREQSDLYCLDRIEKIKQGWAGKFEIKTVLSGLSEGSDWEGPRGFVTEHLPDNLEGGSHAYLCGPPPMLDAAMEVLQLSGIDESNIFFDKFSDQTSV